MLSYKYYYIAIIIFSLLSLFLIKIDMFKLRKLLLTTDSVHTNNFRFKINKIVDKVLLDSGFSKSELRDITISNMDEHKNIKIELFIFKKGNTNDIEKMIQI